MNEEDEVVETPFIEIGRTGLKRQGGLINQEWLRQLKGQTRSYRAYSEMRDNDAVIGGILYAIENLIRQVKWNVVPAHEGADAQEAAAFLEECLIDMDVPWEQFLSEVLSMLPYGFSIFEVIYKLRAGPHQADIQFKSRYNDGRIGWRKFAPRGQDTVRRWEFSDEGSIQGFYQVAPPDYDEVLIPMDKCILFRTKIERNNPEGRSLLRNAYRSWFFLKRLQEIEAIGVERDLAGLPVMQVPAEIMSPSATSAQKTLRSSLEQIIQQIRRDEREGVVMPSEQDRQGKPTGYKLSLLSTGGGRQMNTDQIIRRYESRIAMSVLAEFILLGTDQTGSYALSSSKTEMFATALRSILETIAETVNRFAVDPLFRMNPEFSEECWPELTYGDIETQDLAGLSAYIQGMANAGLLTPDKNLEDHLREVASLPTIKEDDQSMGLEEGLFGPDETAIMPGDNEPTPRGSVERLSPEQVKNISEIVQAVAGGGLPSSAGRAILRFSYPELSDDNLNELLGGEG